MCSGPVRAGAQHPPGPAAAPTPSQRPPAPPFPRGAAGGTATAAISGRHVAPAGSSRGFGLTPRPPAPRNAPRQRQPPRDGGPGRASSLRPTRQPAQALGSPLWYLPPRPRPAAVPLGWTEDPTPRRAASLTFPSSSGKKKGGGGAVSRGHLHRSILESVPIPSLNDIRGSWQK